MKKETIKNLINELKSDEWKTYIPLEEGYLIEDFELKFQIGSYDYSKFSCENIDYNEIETNLSSQPDLEDIDYINIILCDMVEDEEMTILYCTDEYIQWD